MTWLAFVLACAPDDPVPAFVTVTHTGAPYAHKAAGAFGTGPITDGESVSFTFDAAIGDRLFVAAMLTETNDTFLSPDAGGIALYDGSTPITADVTAALSWYDAGTEANEPVGLGASQQARQTSPGMGDPDPDATVRLATGDLPGPADVRLHVSHARGLTFTATLSVHAATFGGAPLAVAPGAWAVGGGFFDTVLYPSLEAVVEDADPSQFPADGAVGVTVPLGQPFWVVTSDAEPLFADGAPDFGEGLEALAEDGDAGDLAATWADRDATSWGFVNTPSGTGSYEPGPVLPGQSYLLQLQSTRGDRLHLAWMYAESNDVVFATDPEGVSIVDRDGVIEGAVAVDLWDVGTEVDEPPGWGADQPARQAGPDTGTDEGGVVRRVEGVDYGDPASLVRVEVHAEAPTLAR